MKIITLLAQKGGTGKTTLSIHLAVMAASSGRKTAIADIDPQKSTVFWRNRKQKKSVEVVALSADQLTDAIQEFKTRDLDLLIIDTAPHAMDDASTAAKAADYILIPSRPAILDLEAIGSSVKILKKTQKKGKAAKEIKDLYHWIIKEGLSW